MVVLGQYWVILVSTWWNWINIKWYWSVVSTWYTGLILGVLGGNGHYLVVLGHY